MPPGVKAELIEGVVYIVPPVSEDFHGLPAFGPERLARRLSLRHAGRDRRRQRHRPARPRQRASAGYLPPDPSRAGGQSKRRRRWIRRGAPELVVEVAASSASYDLGTKLNAYRRNGVREYIVRRTYDDALDWFVLRHGRFEPLAAGPDGIYRSEVFPGLWLDAAALLRGDLATVLRVAQQGTSLAGARRIRPKAAGRITGPSPSRMNPERRSAYDHDGNQPRGDRHLPFCCCRSGRLTTPPPPHRRLPPRRRLREAQWPGRVAAFDLATPPSTANCRR